MNHSLNSDWQTKKLGEICTIKTGKKDVNQGNPLGIYPFFTCAKEHTYSDEYSFDDEALLIAGNGDVGSVSYYKGKFEAYQRTYVLTSFQGMVPRFLFLLLDGLLKDSVSKQKLGNTMPYIKRGMLTDFQIPVPPLTEQHRIVKILDEAFAAISKAKKDTEKNFQNARELFETYLRNIFEVKSGSKTVKLSDVCKISSKLVDPKNSKYQSLIHVGGANIESKSGKLVDLKTAKEEKLISGKFVFDKEMILYSKIRPYLVKIARPDFTGLCSADIYPLFSTRNILIKDYLYYLLYSPNFTEYAIKGSGRAGMPKVNRNHLFDFDLHLPAIDEQKIIVAKLDALAGETKKLEEIYKQKSVLLEELKKSLLHQAFSGKL